MFSAPIFPSIVPFQPIYYRALLSGGLNYDWVHIASLQKSKNRLKYYGSKHLSIPKVLRSSASPWIQNLHEKVEDFIQDKPKPICSFNLLNSWWHEYRKSLSILSVMIAGLLVSGKHVQFLEGLFQQNTLNISSKETVHFVTRKSLIQSYTEQCKA